MRKKFERECFFRASKQSEKNNVRRKFNLKSAVIKSVALTTAALMLAGCGSSKVQSIATPHIASSAGTAEEAIGYDTNSGIELFKSANSTAPEMYAEVECVDGGYIEPWMVGPDFNTEEYNNIEENGFKSVFSSPLSTFAADVDTASYSNLRRMLDWGYSKDEIPAGAIRAEEIINYFSYDYNGPKNGEPFGVNAEISKCPWNEDNLLLRIGLQTEAIDFSDAADSNIVFLIDVSGSMEDPDKLPLLKQAFSMLVDELGEKDRVSIVTYAGSDEVVLEGVSADHKEKIKKAINNLDAYGSTNGGEGIKTAYELAEEYFIEGGNNRVILATDGDLNVGITSESELTKLIKKEKETGVFLSVLGFGTGNYSDTNLEALADKGNGNYSYIDSVKEAKKVLVDELGATMNTVAKDTKLQVEFNPAYVKEYRQIGYENRAMAAEDFADDKKDGGEIGAGHSVTVLYELVPASDEGAKDAGLKYQKTEVSEDAGDNGEWLTLSIRYKEPNEDESKLLEYVIGEENFSKKPSDDFVFAAAAAEFAMYLTDSEYICDGSIRHVKQILADLDPEDEYKSEFVDLVYMLR